MTNKKIEIVLEKELYNELKETCLVLKNINVFGKKYKLVSDEEIGAIISLALKQKEFRESLQKIKELAKNGTK